RAASKSQRRTQAPDELKSATSQAAETQPKTIADWIRWLAQLQGLETAWNGQVDGENVAADFVEAHRIVGSMVRELLALQTDAVLPHEVTAGELLRIPVDVRNAGKEVLKDAKLIANLVGTGDWGSGTGKIGDWGSGTGKIGSRQGLQSGELIARGERNGGYKGFSSIEGLAGSPSNGFSRLPNNSFISTRRNLWANASIETGSDFSGSKYRRRAWQFQPKGLSPIFDDSEGISERNLLPLDFGLRLRLFDESRFHRVGATNRSFGENAQPTYWFVGFTTGLTGPQSPVPSPRHPAPSLQPLTAELALGNLKSRELRRELLILKVPEELTNKRA
ncbi:MAG: hypothetical protein NZ805_16195, partial [Armatimonadetes bacterium]|nr:hypothetical protein [Armatimonadota bacterium]